MKKAVTLPTLILFIFLLNNFSVAQSITPQLKVTPVIIKGSRLNLLSIYKPADLVGFKYDGNRWKQIIIQIDEMKAVSGAQIYNNAGLQKRDNPEDSWDGRGGPEYDMDGKTGGKNAILVYADPNTFTGADDNPFFDDNDELVYMARDGGLIPPANNLYPPGVDICTGVQIQSTDPNSGLTAYIYIFKRDPDYISPSTGTYLQQDAGLSHPVTYNFTFKHNNTEYGPADYKQFYHLQYGPNAERSTVTTPNYIKGFGDRWIENKLVITTPPSSAELLSSAKLNVIDGHKIAIVNGLNSLDVSCGRTENTFSGTTNDDVTPRPQDATAANSTKGYGGAFIANIDGPLRAIRSFMGANSGVLTQRDNICYEQMEVINTILRVHGIDGVVDFYDYAPGAGKMIYNNNNNMPATPQLLNGHVFNGILIDGEPDNINNGILRWEMINSESGTIFRYNRLRNPNFIFGLNQSTHYYDNKSPNLESEPQCTGDAIAWGASGLIVKAKNIWGQYVQLPNSDIRAAGGAKGLSLTQYNFYLQPETPLNERTAWMNTVDKEISTIATAWQSTPDCENRKKVAADIFPNPNNGRFTLRIGGLPYQEVKIYVYDIAGKQIFYTKQIGQLEKLVDLGNLVQNGVYIVSINIDGRTINKKIVVSK